MRYDIIQTSRFRKDVKTAKSRGSNLHKLVKVIALLAEGDQPLPADYLDHKLTGIWKGFRECHISPDWLLIYKKERQRLILTLTRTGSHQDLFNE